MVLMKTKNTHILSFLDQMPFMCFDLQLILLHDDTYEDALEIEAVFT